MNKKKLAILCLGVIAAGALAAPTAQAVSHTNSQQTSIPTSYTDISTLNIIDSHEEAHSTDAGSSRP